MSVHSALALRLAPDGEEPTVSLHWICRQLGFSGSHEARKRYVSGLIQAEGFPHPLPHLAHGGRVSRAIHPARSQWLRAGVDAWLADFLPPAGHAALDAAAERAAAADMDGAALRLVGGTEA